MDHTANQITDVKHALQEVFEIQRHHHDLYHGSIPVYTTGDLVTTRLKTHLIVALPTDTPGPKQLPSFPIVRVMSGGQAIELDLPPH